MKQGDMNSSHCVLKSSEYIAIIWRAESGPAIRPTRSNSVKIHTDSASLHGPVVFALDFFTIFDVRPDNRARCCAKAELHSPLDPTLHDSAHSSSRSLRSSGEH
jgi:hypothetical protein